MTHWWGFMLALLDSVWANQGGVEASLVTMILGNLCLRRAAVSLIHLKESLKKDIALIYCYKWMQIMSHILFNKKKEDRSNWTAWKTVLDLENYHLNLQLPSAVQSFIAHCLSDLLTALIRSHRSHSIVCSISVPKEKSDEHSRAFSS